MRKVFVFVLVLLLAFPSLIFATVESPTVDIPLKDVHVGVSWEDFDHECDSDVVVPEGKVLWHLIASPVDSEAIASIDGVLGEQKGSTTGKGAIHWTFITDDLVAPEWVAVFSNGVEYKNNGKIQTDLRVSHTCYGGDVISPPPPEEDPTAKITIKKEVVGTSRPVIFDFIIKTTQTDRANEWVEEFSLGDGDEMTFTVTPGAYQIIETINSSFSTVIDSTQSEESTSSVVINVIEDEDRVVLFINTYIPPDKPDKPDRPDKPDPPVEEPPIEEPPVDPPADIEDEDLVGPTEPVEPVNPDVPQTGLLDMSILYGFGMAASGAGLYKLKRKPKE